MLEIDFKGGINSFSLIITLKVISHYKEVLDTYIGIEGFNKLINKLGNPINNLYRGDSIVINILLINNLSSLLYH